MNQLTDRAGHANDVGTRIEFEERRSLRLHEKHKELPSPDKESPQWAAFLLALSGAGAEGIPPLIVTPDCRIMDGERRWLAAKQLDWDQLPVMRRPDSEASAIIVDSLLGQRHLTKGAKIYLAVPLLEDFVASAENRRLQNLKRGSKTIEKALKSPNTTEWGSGKGWAEIAERFGCGVELLRQAVVIRRLFTRSGEHKFDFQRGPERTLREHFEPQILDSEAPMGLGEVLKGCGWFVDENGNRKKQAGPPERNSYLHYFQSAWGNFNKQFERWEKLKGTDRARAIELIQEGITEWPVEVLEVVSERARKVKNTKTANQR
jgi:hypothetical protein